MEYDFKYLGMTLENTTLDHPSILKFFNGGSRAPEYLASGLWVLAKSQGNNGQLLDLMNQARSMNVRGFHPTIPASLFGAAHGYNELPKEIFSEKFNPDRFLERTQSEFKPERE